MRDGLHSAIEDEARGTPAGGSAVGGEVDRESVERRVVRGWGEPRELAGEFNAVWSVVRAKCLARRVLVATPLLTALWAVVVLAGRDPWPREPVFVAVTSRLLAGSVAVAVVSALLIVSTHRGAVLRCRAPVAPALGVLGGLTAATVLLAMMLCDRAVAGPHAVEWVLVIAPGLLTPVVLAATVRDALGVRGARRLTA